MTANNISMRNIREIADLMDGPIVVVDIGAQSLQNERHVYSALYDLDCPVQVIGFEPLASRAAARRMEERGRTTEIIEAFVGTGEVHTFHEVNSSAASSLLPLNNAVCSEFYSLTGLRTCSKSEVQTSRLDDLLGGIPAVDFLKLDIQGFELRALQGAERVLARTAMIQCETEFVPIYNGQPLFAEVEMHLRAHGFEFLDFHAPGYRAPVVPSGRVRNEQLLWADAVFGVRTDRATDRQLLAEAIVAAVIYRKLSVAERSLAAYDTRRGTFLAQKVAAMN